VKLLDIKAVAERLSCSVRTVERLKKDGKLPPHRLVLGCHRWPEDEIEAFIRALPRFDAVEVRA
jgi:hypothetical protein